MTEKMPSDKIAVVSAMKRKARYFIVCKECGNDRKNRDQH
jgi:hypothetical protein